MLARFNINLLNPRTTKDPVPDNVNQLSSQVLTSQPHISKIKHHTRDTLHVLSEPVNVAQRQKGQSIDVVKQGDHSCRSFLYEKEMYNSMPLVLDEVKQRAEALDFYISSSTIFPVKYFIFYKVQKKRLTSWFDIFIN